MITILKISLIISVLAYIFLLLVTYRAIGIYKRRLGEEVVKRRVPITEHIRVIILSLIPILNVFMLIAYVYMFLFLDGDSLLSSIKL